MISPKTKGGVDVFEMILQTQAGQTALTSVAKKQTAQTNWQPPPEDGQLAVDVAETETDIVVVSTMAGATADKVEVYVHSDLLTIRGQRRSPLGRQADLNYFHQECFWGVFSRTIILPVDVKGERAKAEYRNGVLTVWLPKRNIEAKIPVKIVED